MKSKMLIYEFMSNMMQILIPVTPKGTDSDNLSYSSRLQAWGDFAKDAKRLGEKSRWRASFDLVRTWAIIILALWTFFSFPSWISGLIVFVIVSTQQYALLILMHDGQHYLLYSNRHINLFVSKWLIGSPCGTPFQHSQQQHLAHHRALGSAIEDPAYQFYCFGEPSPKNSLGRLLWHFTRILVAGRVAYTLFGQKSSFTNAEHGTSLFKRLEKFGPIILMQIPIFIVFASTGFWWAYLLLWVLPLFTLVSFFDAFRQFAEHACPVPDSTGKILLISTRSNLLERFFFAPFSMNFHAEHHFFPFVPYYRLAELSRRIRTHPKSSEIQWRTSYLGSLLHFSRALEQQN